MDLRTRAKHSRNALPIGTIRTRTAKRDSGGRFNVQVIKVHGNGQAGWIHYARWLWEHNKGPVPKGKRVIHRDGDTMNNRLDNLMLAESADVIHLFCHADPAKSAENHRRCAAGRARFNREIAWLRRTTEILPSKWYAVDVAAKLIINKVYRKRIHLFQSAGAPNGGRKNGAGWLGWVLGWPSLSGIQASILAELAEGQSENGSDLKARVDALRGLHGLRPITIGVIHSNLTELRQSGLIVGRRCVYQITQAAQDARGEQFPYAAVRGAELLSNEKYAGFKLGQIVEPSPFADEDDLEPAEMEEICA